MRSTTLLALAGTALLAQARDQLTFSNPLAAVDRLVSGSASAASSALMGAERWAAEGVRQFGQKYHDDGEMHCESSGAGSGEEGRALSGEAGASSEIVGRMLMIDWFDLQMRLSPTMTSLHTRFV